MEVGLVTDVFADKDLDGLLKTCTDLRLKQLEFSCGNYTGGKFFNVDKMLNDSKHRDEIIAKIKDHNFKISALSCHGNPIAPGPYGKQHDEITRKTIKLASVLKIDKIICLSGCAGGPGDSNPNWIVTAWPPEKGKILEWQWNEVLVPYWKDVANYAENLGVKICFELHGGDMVYNVPTTHRIRDQASKNIGANFDPSHLIWMGGDPVQMVKNLGEAVFYVHIKDVKIDPVQKSLNTLLDTTWFADVNGRSWNFCIPGHGHDERWWSEFLLALRSIGYEDVLSIEHEDCSLGRNEGMRLTIEFLERILINETVDYEWSKEKINQLLELWKKGIPEEEVSKIDKQ
tara:strand:+ start:117 stop:1148 length:1032 start_codon:yes stop_codon:yes gene_type:complete